MEKYYKKHQMLSLYFGAYYSGDRYYLPTNTLSQLEFNRYNNPYYNEFLDLPKTGKISLLKNLEPIYKKQNINGSDRTYSLASRTDTITVNLEKLRSVYSTNNLNKEISSVVNYFGNNLTFKLKNPNLSIKQWSNEDDLNFLINDLNFSYLGEPGSANTIPFSGKGYLLQGCNGCIDDTDVAKTIATNAAENCDDCLENEKFRTTSFSISLKYNPYNILSDAKKQTALDSERIKSTDFLTKSFISFNINDNNLKDVFTLTTSTQDGAFYRDKSYVPLFFKTLNINSKKLVPFVNNEYSDDFDLNRSGEKITSYKYVPNINSEKVFGSKIINEDTILHSRNISLQAHSKNIYSALISGVESYEYEVSNSDYGPKAEQIEEEYFKYYDSCANYHLIPRRPVQIRLRNLTGQEAFLYEELSSGSNLGYSISVNGSGNTIVVGAPNATLNNVSKIGLVFVITGQGNDWKRTAKLTGSDSQSNDQFGFSSCINRAGTVFAIGAPNASIDNISGAGAVYIFTGKNQNWSGIAKITGSSSYSGYKFGSSLSMNSAGNVLIAGAPRANNFSGSVYIFTGNENSWKEASIINKRINSNLDETGSYFGYSVAINDSGNLVVVGAPNEKESTGLAYIYTGNSYENKNWDFSGFLYNDLLSKGYFGYSVAINSGNIICVGAPIGNQGIGLVYIYKGPSSQKLSGSQKDSFFGSSLAINSIGNVLIVGSPKADITGINISEIQDAGMISAFVYSGIV